MGHNIYIDRLINKNACLVQEDNDAYELNNLRCVTVDDEIEYMTKELAYLDNWQHEVKNQKRLAREFLDVCTYKNIHTGIAGGLYYARDILLLPKGECPQSVPYLDLNTSPLENVFCQIHHTDRDSLDMFHKGITAVSLNEQEKKV